MKSRAVQILDCPVTRLSRSEFVERAEEFIQSRRPHYIAVVNAAKLVRMQSDGALREAVLSADLIGADGVPIVWVSRLLGDRLPGRVNGTDLMYELLERANQKGYRVFFFGAREEVLQTVLRKIRKEYPHVVIAGSRNGYFEAADEPEIVRKIKNSKADILFIAFGTPQKELWVRKYLADMEVPVVHGVGGSFDVLAGNVPRAPIWMQRTGLEWLFRLLQEPRRMWRRYLYTNTTFILLAGKEIFSRRFRWAQRARH